jgi:hypothetical protein
MFLGLPDLDPDSSLLCNNLDPDASNKQISKENLDFYYIGTSF